MLRLIPLFCPIAIWITLLFFFTALFLAVAQGRRQLQKLHRIPCSRCVFCTGDYRLKCAVHPMRAFSEEAIDCRDFEREIQENPLNSLPLLTVTFHWLWSVSK
ncbi:MAG: hypothetical protein ACKPGT_13135, partial [Microcystis sp.]